MMKKMIMLSVALLTVSALTLRKFFRKGSLPGLHRPMPEDQYGW